jgi:hypothetical protein
VIWLSIGNCIEIFSYQSLIVLKLWVIGHLSVFFYGMNGATRGLNGQKQVETIEMNDIKPDLGVKGRHCRLFVNIV